MQIKTLTNLRSSDPETLILYKFKVNEDTKEGHYRCQFVLFITRYNQVDLKKVSNLNRIHKFISRYKICILKKS